MSASQAHTVLISGAGPAGLTLALLLARAGWHPVVIEKDATLRGGGFLVSLADSAYECLCELGLGEKLTARGSGITRSIYYNAQQQSLLRLNTQALFGDLPVLQLMRDDLTDVLFQAASNEVDIRMGVTLVAVTQDNGVTATLSSGDTIQANLLVGADGVHSNTRTLAFPPAMLKERFLGLHCAAYRHSNVEGLSHCFETHTQRNRYMATFTTGGDDVGSVFVWRDASRAIPSADQREYLNKAFSGSTGRTAAHLAQCPATPIYYDVLKQIEMTRWHHRHSVLLGDAAHCLTLFSGRGAAAAVNDARVLAEVLLSASANTALARYDQLLRANLTEMQASTRRDVRWYVPRNAIDYALRNLIFRLAPASWFHRFFQHKYRTVGSN